MEKYCLGYMHDKCDKCEHQQNWYTLNQLPDALRKALQASMTRVNSDKCRLTSMSEYAESNV